MKSFLISANLLMTKDELEQAARPLEFIEKFVEDAVLMKNENQFTGDGRIVMSIFEYSKTNVTLDKCKEQVTKIQNMSVRANAIKEAFSGKNIVIRISNDVEADSQLDKSFERLRVKLISTFQVTSGR